MKLNSKVPKIKLIAAIRLFANPLLLVTLVLVASLDASLFADEVKHDAATVDSGNWLRHWRTTNKVWRGVHVMVGNSNAASNLIAELPALAALGVNALVLEINYSFAFQSHPELRNASAVTKEQAARLARACRERGIRPIPLFNCLGHQSWSKNTGPLLTKYPELDETPGQFPENQGIYCRSWCPQHPKVNPRARRMAAHSCGDEEMKRLHLVSVAAWSVVLLATSAKAATAGARLRAAQNLINARAGELLLSLRPATDGIRVAGLRNIASRFEQRIEFKPRSVQAWELVF